MWYGNEVMGVSIASCIINYVLYSCPGYPECKTSKQNKYDYSIRAGQHTSVGLSDPIQALL